MFEKTVIAISNRLTRMRRPQIAPEELLILAPHCLQSKDCKIDLKPGIQGCERCGKCRCRDLLDLTLKYGVRTLVANGGMEAINSAKTDATKAVVAIACPAELRAGIISVFPKPVVAIANQRPDGPCRNTDVIIDEVEAAVIRLLKPISNPESTEGE